jgi:hypothetical protein
MNIQWQAKGFPENIDAPHLIKATLQVVYRVHLPAEVRTEKAQIAVRAPNVGDWTR